MTDFLDFSTMIADGADFVGGFGPILIVVLGMLLLPIVTSVVIGLIRGDDTPGGGSPDRSSGGGGSGMRLGDLSGFGRLDLRCWNKAGGKAIGSMSHDGTGARILDRVKPYGAMTIGEHRAEALRWAVDRDAYQGPDVGVPNVRSTKKPDVENPYYDD